MSDKNFQSDEKTVVKEVLSTSAIERRRALFKGAGKGAAVLGAVVPLNSLANETLLTFDGKHHCSISGMHSGVHSKTPTNSPVCGGYSPGWWGQSVTNTYGNLVPKNWPATLPGGHTYNTKCDVVFNKCVLRNDDGTKPSLFQVMEPKEPISKFANTDEFHWICAWLNAATHSFNFPYSAAEVVGFYNNTAQYADALSFFKTYMETHIS